ncbi:MAG: c-type cytochrome [Bryobacteraceae bacterium]
MRRALTSTTLCLIAIGGSGPAYGQKHWDAPAIVTSYCSGCHGIDGNTELPYFPRLAELDPAYVAKKLAQFQEIPPPSVDELYGKALNVLGTKQAAGNITRNERINMEGVAHAAKPEAIKQAVLWYAQQRPAPGRRGPKDLVQQGQELFTKGVPEQKILACVNCHGQDAHGKSPAPRLAGQNAEYIEAQLDKFRKGDRKHAPEMTIVTRDLNPDQAHAVAVYLQSK